MNEGSTYEKFLPREFLSHLGEGNEESVNSSATKELSLLFADFQTLVSSVDKMVVSDAFEFLNFILSRIATPISVNNGFVHQFLGDTLTALFSGSSEEVVRASVQIITSIREMQHEKKLFANRKYPDIRLGLHYGPMKLGTVKFTDYRYDTSFLSPAVPITKQLVLFAKTLNIPIIATNVVMDRLNSQRDLENQDVICCCLGKFFFKEFGATFELHQLYDKRWDAFLFSDERKKQFLKGLEMFQQRKFVAAMTIFSKLHKLNDNDLVSQFFSKVSKMYQQVQPPQNWDGCVLIDRDCKPNPIGSKSNSFYLQTGISAYHHFGDEQLLSNGKDKEEEIKLLNESLNQKSVTIRDMKEILSVKELEIARLQEITDVLVKEKKTDVEKLKHQVEQLKSRLGEGSGRSWLRKNDTYENSSPNLFSKCFPCISSPKKDRRIAPETDNRKSHTTPKQKRRSTDLHSNR